MTAPLSIRRSLDPDTMWRSMRRLLDRVYGVLDRDSLVDDCLDILVELLAVPAVVCAVVDRALAFDRGQRWESAAKMRSALRSAHPYEPLG